MTIYGIRRGVLDVAVFFRTNYYTFFTPGLFNGQFFEKIREVEIFAQENEISGFIKRTMTSVKDRPSDDVYARFSNGGASALLLAGTRSDAKGCLLFCAALPLQMGDPHIADDCADAGSLCSY